MHHRPTIRAGQREREGKIEGDKKRKSPTVKAGNNDFESRNMLHIKLICCVMISFQMYDDD